MGLESNGRDSVVIHVPQGTEHLRPRADALWEEAQAFAKRKLYRAALKHAEQSMTLIQDIDYGRWDDWNREADTWRVAIGERTWWASAQEFVHRFVPLPAPAVAVLVFVLVGGVWIWKNMVPSRRDDDANTTVVTATGGRQSSDIPHSSSAWAKIPVNVGAPSPQVSVSAAPVREYTARSEAAESRISAWLKDGVGNHERSSAVLPLRETALALDDDEVQIGSFVCKIEFDRRGDPSKVENCEGRGAARTRNQLRSPIRCTTRDDRKWIDCWSDPFEYELSGRRKGGIFALSLGL
jgi:hypothetical protein